uniref:GHMP kinase N-terminal domain-containing protein n=1 Tax=Setaria italica TaxID=4555 RepID=K3ZFT3_SETIT
MEVRARAPGKIILAGEHAVVHGSAAVAAAIDLYTTSSLSLLPEGGPRPPWIRFFVLRHCRRPHLRFFVLHRGGWRCRRGGAGPQGLVPHLLVAVLAHPQGAGGGGRQGRGADAVLP